MRMAMLTLLCDRFQHPPGVQKHQPKTRQTWLTSSIRYQLIEGRFKVCY